MPGTSAHAGIPNGCLQLQTMNGKPYIQFNPPGLNGCTVRGLTDDQGIQLKWEWTGPEGYVQVSEATFLAKYKGATLWKVGWIHNERRRLDRTNKLWKIEFWTSVLTQNLPSIETDDFISL